MGVYMEELGLSLTNPTLAQVRALSRLRDALRAKREIDDLTSGDEERLAVLDRIQQQLVEHAQHLQRQSHSMRTLEEQIRLTLDNVLSCRRDPHLCSPARRRELDDRLHALLEEQKRCQATFWEFLRSVRPYMFAFAMALTGVGAVGAVAHTLLQDATTLVEAAAVFARALAATVKPTMAAFSLGMFTVNPVGPSIWTARCDPARRTHAMTELVRFLAEKFSDRALKTGIRRLPSRAFAPLHLYRFRWTPFAHRHLGLHGTATGVMADEVARHFPSAVRWVQVAGRRFRKVNFARLLWLLHQHRGRR